MDLATFKSGTGRVSFLHDQGVSLGGIEVARNDIACGTAGGVANGEGQRSCGSVLMPPTRMPNARFVALAAPRVVRSIMMLLLQYACRSSTWRRKLVSGPWEQGRSKATGNGHAYIHTAAFPSSLSALVCIEGGRETAAFLFFLRRAARNRGGVR